MNARLLAALATLVVVAGCGANPWAVDSFEAPEADVAGKHSFLWRDGEVAAPLVKQPEMAAQAQARLRAAITEELVHKGYVETTDARSADMVVTVQVAGSRRYVQQDQRRIGAPSPNQVLTPGNVPPRPASELPPEKSIRQGSVVVFAEDPATGRLMWRGVVDAEIRASSVERTVTQVVDMARHITRGFPARRAAP